jgi:hypothetical protein
MGVYFVLLPARMHRNKDIHEKINTGINKH